MNRVLLSARGLEVGYPGRSVLSGVDVDIRAGEVFAFIGPNGSGKTTLFRALSGELSPLSGQVFVSCGRKSAADAQGVPLVSLSRRKRAEIIARVLQSEEPAWALSVRDYVEAGVFASSGWFGPTGIVERGVVEKALESMDLAGFVSRPVTELSGGEFRRVLIARALAQRSPILLLDEPAADLDLARQMETLGLLRTLAAEGRAVVFSVHDLNLASLVADRVALVSGGGIAAVGSPREVITAGRVASAYKAKILVRDHPLGDVPYFIHAPEWLVRRDGEDRNA